MRGIRPGDRSEGVCARGWDWQDHGTCGCPRAGTGPALQTAACIQRISSDADSPEPDRGQLCCRHSWADGGCSICTTSAEFRSTVSLQITEASNQLLLLGRDPPQLDAPPAQVEAAVRIADQVRRGAAVPDTLFRVISLSLHGFADLKIDELAWGEQIQAGSSNSPAAETATLDPLLNDPAMNGAAIPESGITMRLRGVQSPFNGDLRRAIARIESYVDRLRNLPEVMEVEVLQLPLDVTPTSSLSGEVGSGRKAESKAQFEIRLKVRMEQDDTAETSA